jgi:SNF2 family DNA or RNA helicase
VSKPTRRITLEHVRKTGNIFEDSSLILCELIGWDQTSAIRTVSVARPLAEKLKPRQVEGVQFMWRNCFSDLATHREGNQDLVGGCILAHNQGLGDTVCNRACSYDNDTSVLGE